MGTYQDALKRKMKQHPGDKQGAIKPANLHMPKPDPDPKAPNEYKPNKGGKSNVNTGLNRGGKNKPQNNHNGNSGSSFTGGGGGQGNGGNNANAFLPATDPRDDRYWRDVFTLNRDRDLKLQNLDVEDRYARNAFNEATLGLKLQQPKDILNYQEGSNRGGSFYSSRTGEGVGDIVKQYFEQGSQLNRDYETSTAQRNLERQTIDNQYQMSLSDLLAGATDRASAAEADRPMPAADSYAQALLDRITSGGGGNQGGSGRGPTNSGGGRGPVNSGNNNQGNKNKDKDKHKKKKNK